MTNATASPFSRRRSSRRVLVAVLVLLAGTAAASERAAASCSTVSGAERPTVIELYTSEGCSSCPPADRWLSTQRHRADVVAVAFHVTYWDHLGWRDRFASKTFAARQAEQLPVNGARYRYTPQVVIDGDDRADWPRASAGRPTAARRATVDVALRREGAQYVAVVKGATGAPARLGGWWALTENGQSSAVRSGENAGAMLRHDGIVRVWETVPDWSTGATRETTLRWSPAAPADMGTARDVVFVVTDLATGKPVQAVKLGC